MDGPNSSAIHCEGTSDRESKPLDAPVRTPSGLRSAGSSRTVMELSGTIETEATLLDDEAAIFDVEQAGVFCYRASFF